MLHPQAKALLGLMIERGVPPTHTLSPAEARKLLPRAPRRHTAGAARDRRGARPERGRPRTAAIPLRLYRPLAESQRGAAPRCWCTSTAAAGSSATSTRTTRCAASWPTDRAARWWRSTTAWAPSTAFRPRSTIASPPRAGCASMRANSASMRTRLAVGGDSAGGNLAAVVALASRATPADDPPIAFQLLIYPATDQRRGAPSHTSNGQGYLLTRETMDYFHDHYIDDKAHDQDWRASPLLHPDLSRLPPALVLTAGYDPLRDEGAAVRAAAERSRHRRRAHQLRAADPRLHHHGPGHRRGQHGGGAVRGRVAPRPARVVRRRAAASSAWHTATPSKPCPATRAAGGTGGVAPAGRSAGPARLAAGRQPAAHPTPAGAPQRRGVGRAVRADVRLPPRLAAFPRRVRSRADRVGAARPARRFPAHRTARIDRPRDGAASRRVRRQRRRMAPPAAAGDGRPRSGQGARLSPVAAEGGRAPAGALDRSRPRRPCRSSCNPT